MFLIKLITKNGHKLTHFSKAAHGRKYESIFTYSNRHGGTIDGFKYYNNYVVDITE